MTLAITIGGWHYSRSRVIGNVVDSITEPNVCTQKLGFGYWVGYYTQT